MANDDKEIIDFIKNSFLSEADKERVLGVYAAEGESDDFYKQLNSAFADKLLELTDQCEKAFNGLDVEADKVKQEFLAAKKELDGALDKNLESIEVTDIEARGKIWDKYYQDLAKLEDDNTEKLKSVASQAVISSM